MAPNPRRQDERLDALYARLPKIACQGFCHDSCGPIEMTIRERARIEKAAGRPVTCAGIGSGVRCSLLTADGRCSQYDLRPLICRLWGLTESMPCHFGCRPEGGLLTDYEGMRLLAEADLIGGDPGNRERQMTETLERIAGEFEEREAEVEMRKYMRRVTRPPSAEGQDNPFRL